MNDILITALRKITNSTAQDPIVASNMLRSVSQHAKMALCDYNEHIKSLSLLSEMEYRTDIPVHQECFDERKKGYFLVAHDGFSKTIACVDADDKSFIFYELTIHSMINTDDTWWIESSFTLPIDSIIKLSKLIGATYENQCD